MLKLLGSGCILGAGLMLRMFHVQENRREISVLKDLLTALTRMENEIRLNRTPLPRMLEKLSANCGADVQKFFLAVRGALEKGELLPSAWRRAAGDLPISADGQASLAEVSQKLGGDEREICNGILFAGSSLKRELEEKLKGQADFEKRSTAICLSGAALLAILLI